MNKNAKPLYILLPFALLGLAGISMIVWVILR
jgi:hypothetical protein